MPPPRRRVSRRISRKGLVRRGRKVHKSIDEFIKSKTKSKSGTLSRRKKIMNYIREHPGRVAAGTLGGLGLALAGGYGIKHRKSIMDKLRRKATEVNEGGGGGSSHSWVPEWLRNKYHALLGFGRRRRSRRSHRRRHSRRRSRRSYRRRHSRRRSSRVHHRRRHSRTMLEDVV